MAIMNSKIERESVDIKFEGQEFIIKIGGKEIKSCKQFYINCGTDRMPSILLDIYPKSLNFDTGKTEMAINKTNLDEIDVESLLEIIHQRIIKNTKVDITTSDDKDRKFIELYIKE